MRKRAPIGVVVHVVHASRLHMDDWARGGIIAGCYATRQAAELARRQANIDHGRTPGTMGSFVVTQVVTQ